MNFYLDTEFKERPHTIDLISIGIVSDDGREYYAISRDFNLNGAWRNEWLRRNVLESIHQDLCEKMPPLEKTHYWKLFEPFTKRSLRNLLNWHGKSNHIIAREIIEFVGNPKEIDFYAYYADYDWVAFCWLFGRMLNLPSGFPMYCRDLKQMMDERGLSKKWTAAHCPKPKNVHNALGDASWNKALFDAIKSHDESSGTESVERWKKKFEEKARQKMYLGNQLDRANQKLIDAGLKKPAIQENRNDRTA